jgi:outer membrane murein-binding lipoprotein Lpp
MARCARALLLVAAFIIFAGLHVGEAQDSTGSPLASDVAALRKEIAKMQRDMETLRAENAALQRENESLRRLLSTRSADQPANASRTNSVRQPGSPRPASPATETRSNAVPDSLQRPAAPSQSTAYWLSTWSGLRHNSGCRYYRNSAGKPCGPNEGKACKLCGG